MQMQHITMGLIDKFLQADAARSQETNTLTIWRDVHINLF